MNENPIAVGACWLALAASFALSFTTWLALGTLAGFGLLAWVMPVCVDAYIVCALVTWLAPVSSDVARFAKINMYGIAGAGVAAQSAYHGYAIAAATHNVWQASLAAVVGALPPLIAALSVHMRGLVRREANQPVASRPGSAATAPAPAAPATLPEPSSLALRHPNPSVPLPSPAPEPVPARERASRSAPRARRVPVAAAKPAAAQPPAPGSIPRRQRSQIDRAAVLAALAEGASEQEIADDIGCHVRSVFRIKAEQQELTGVAS